jgi:aminopeptidase S
MSVTTWGAPLNKPIQLTKSILIALAVGAVLAVFACTHVAGVAAGASVRTAGNTLNQNSAIMKATASEPITQTITVPIAGPNGVQQIAVTLACADVVVNGNFEAPLPGRPWTGVANTPSVIYNDPFINSVRAHTGGQSGRVGSPTVNSYWNELLQTVQLPNGVSSATLTYWRYLDTTETSRTRAYDRFTIGLETEQGIQIVPPQQVSNVSSGRGVWVQETLALPGASAYSGQRLWVSFKGTTDSNLPSSLYVDDVQLTVCSTQ